MVLMNAAALASATYQPPFTQRTAGRDMGAVGAVSTVPRWQASMGSNSTCTVDRVCGRAMMVPACWRFHLLTPSSCSSHYMKAA